MNDAAGIYLIKNEKSGRVYVGSAVKLRRRWRCHRSDLVLGKHHSQKLQKSWDKHGPDAFKFEVIEEVADLERLLEREQFWIDSLSAACSRRGFNMRPKAESNLGKVFSAASRARMSEAGKRRKPDTPQARANKSAARKQIIITAEWREKMAAGNRGRKRSAEGRLNMSNAAKRRAPDSQETREKKSAAMKGRERDPHSEAVRNTIGSKLRAKWQEPEFRSKSIAVRARKLTPELVRVIRSSELKGVDLALRMGVACSVISEVRSRKLWGHVE